MISLGYKDIGVRQRPGVCFILFDNEIGWLIIMNMIYIIILR